MIGLKRAREFAEKWIKEYRLPDRSEQYKILAGLVTGEPLLVNAAKQGYYLVPLVDQKSKVRRAAILVNAYSGDFQEVGVFRKGVRRYLSPDEAAKKALEHLKRRGKPVEISLIFQPSQATMSRFLPVYAVRFSEPDSTVYVSQEGKAFEKLEALPLGR